VGFRVRAQRPDLWQKAVERPARSIVSVISSDIYSFNEQPAGNQQQYADA
jgi:hypothetical protein